VSAWCAQVVVAKGRRLTSDEVEAELDKRDARAEALEGRAVVGESALEQLHLEVEWARDAARRAKEEAAANRTRTARTPEQFCACAD
jgi:transcriptional regulator of nitric oxide reductase